MEQSEKSSLLEAFPPHSYSEWRAAAEALLKGKPFDKLLISPTYEGFSRQPMYMQADVDALRFRLDTPGSGSRVRGQKAESNLGTGWKISQELFASTADLLNPILLQALENGQNEVNLCFDWATRSGMDSDEAPDSGIGRCGLSLNSAEEVKTLIAGVYPDLVSWYLQSGSASIGVLGLFFAGLKAQGISPEQTSGCIESDPIAFLIERGDLKIGIEAALDRMVLLSKDLAELAPEWQSITVDTTGYHNAGASSAQEMAYALSTATFYLKAFQKRGVSPSFVAKRIRFSLAIGADTFIEISKLRAFRMLWNRILEAFEVAEEDRGLHLHGRTGLFNKTIFDPYVNMLRTTMEAFSAVLGGVDSLHIGPFDEIIREPDTFSLRIARNTHTILSGECGLDQVIDPAGGSWAVESFTAQMADKAWLSFQDIESEGGIFAALQSGKVQAAVDSVYDQKVLNIQRRKDILVGTNQYPNAEEKLLEPRSLNYRDIASAQVKAAEAFRAKSSYPETKLDSLQDAIEAAEAGATLAQIERGFHGAADQPLQVKGMPVRRLAGDIETLRFASEVLRASGNPPQLLQVNMGPSRAYRLRADWTSSYFQVAGIEVLGSDDFSSAEEAMAALGKTGAKIAILTSDDSTYADQLVEWAKALKGASPDLYLLVAGAPGEEEAEWRSAGVDDFVHVRVNNYAMNRALLEKLGAKIDA